MKIIEVPQRTHGARELVNDVASGSVNTDAPNFGLEILRVIDRQLEPFGLEVEVFYNGPDALIWKLVSRLVVGTARTFVVEPNAGEQTSFDVATLAGRILSMSEAQMLNEIRTSKDFVKSLRSVAASALTQRVKEVSGG